MTDLFGAPEGERAERVEWGQRATRDTFLIGPKGTVRTSPGEESARGYDAGDGNPGGAHYPGGPRVFEPVRRVIVTYTGLWHDAPDTHDGRDGTWSP